MSEARISQQDGMEKEGWLLQNYQDYVRNQEIVVQKLLSNSEKSTGIRCVATQWRPLFGESRLEGA